MTVHVHCHSVRMGQKKKCCKAYYLCGANVCLFFMAKKQKIPHLATRRLQVSSGQMWYLCFFFLHAVGLCLHCMGELLVLF